MAIAFFGLIRPCSGLMATYCYSTFPCWKCGPSFVVRRNPSGDVSWSMQIGAVKRSPPTINLDGSVLPVDHLAPGGELALRNRVVPSCGFPVARLHRPLRRNSHRISSNGQ
jgi:hypothetical protein